MRQDCFGSPSLLPAHESDGWTFSTADVTRQCKAQRTNTAPGPDTILPIFLAHAGSSVYEALSVIYTFSWTHAV